MSSPDPLWTALSRIRSLRGIHAIWVQRFGDQFQRVKTHLHPVNEIARQYPCLQPCGNGCEMLVREWQSGFLAVCQDEYQQTEPIDLDAEHVVIHALDILSILRNTAKALGVTVVSMPEEVTRHAWHLGGVALDNGKTLPVYFALPMGRATIVDGVRAVLASSRIASIWLIPDMSACDAQSRSLIEGCDGHVLSLGEIARGLPDMPGGVVKPLSSIITAATGATEPAYQFQKKGEMWLIRWNSSEPVFLKNSKGMEYYACLLEQVRRPISAFDLQNGFHPDVDIRRVDSGIDASDADSLQELRSEYDRLNSEISAAQRNNDEALMTRLHGELTTLHEQAQKDFNKRGKSRKADDPQEQARKNVSGAMAEARKRIAASLPELALHLTTSVTGGKVLMYSPPTSIAWNI